MYVHGISIYLSIYIGLMKDPGLISSDLASQLGSSPRWAGTYLFLAAIQAVDYDYIHTYR